MMHYNYFDSLHNALNHHPTPKAKPSGFWSISKCQKFQPHPFYPSEDRIIMTLTSMHPMFQVSIDFCDLSSPNFVWKIHAHLQLCWPSRSCSHSRVEVAKLKLQKLLEFGNVYQNAKIEVQPCSYNLQIAATVFHDMQFLERPSL